MCNEIDLTVCFEGIDLINDQITAEDGVPITPISAIGFVISNLPYGLDKNHNGELQITFHKCEKGIKSLQINGNTTIVGTEFVGGRPQRPIAR